jgi:hypothetical protein
VFPDPKKQPRYDIGVDKLMGSDYPHIEGTWPHTEARLKEGFADYPRRSTHGGGLP